MTEYNFVTSSKEVIRMLQGDTLNFPDGTKITFGLDAQAYLDSARCYNMSHGVMIEMPKFDD